MDLRYLILLGSLGALLGGLTGCTQRQPEKIFVQGRHDADVDFAAYQSYAWVPETAAWANPVFLENPALPGMIGAAVDRQLAEKGYAQTSVAQADFLVAMSASVQDVTVISKHRYQGWSHGYNRAAFGNVNTATQMEKMTEGTLILDIIDRRSEGVVWQSQAAGVITRQGDIHDAVTDAVARMLEKFPPEP